MGKYSIFFVLRPSSHRQIRKYSKSRCSVRPVSAQLVNAAFAVAPPCPPATAARVAVSGGVKLAHLLLQPPPRRAARIMADAASSGDAWLPVAEPARKRLRIKTNLQQACAMQVPEAEVADAHRCVYLVTAAHPSQERSADGRRLVAPASMTREAMAAALRDAAAHPLPDEQWQRRHPGRGSQPAELVMLAVFREYHTATAGGPGRAHFHVAVLFATSVRFAPANAACCCGA